MAVAAARACAGNAGRRCSGSTFRPPSIEGSRCAQGRLGRQGSDSAPGLQARRGTLTSARGCEGGVSGSAHSAGTPGSPAPAQTRVPPATGALTSPWRACVLTGVGHGLYLEALLLRHIVGRGSHERALASRAHDTNASCWRPPPGGTSSGRHARPTSLHTIHGPAQRTATAAANRQQQRGDSRLGSNAAQQQAAHESSSPPGRLSCFLRAVFLL